MSFFGYIRLSGFVSTSFHIKSADYIQMFESRLQLYRSCLFWFKVILQRGCWG